MDPEDDSPPATGQNDVPSPARARAQRYLDLWQASISWLARYGPPMRGGDGSEPR